MKRIFSLPALAVFACASTSSSGTKWGAVDWDSLRPTQCALSTGKANAALEEAKASQTAEEPLSSPEQMWLLIYRGIALDRLGKRTEAVASYRAAAKIHPHPMTRRGIERPLYTLEHLDKMHEVCASAARLGSG